VFLVDDDQAWVLHWREQRRACADDDVCLAVTRGQPGIEALTVADVRVHKGNAGVEALLETRQCLRPQVDLRDQHQGLLACLERFADQLQVNLGLAASCNARQQKSAKMPEAAEHGIESITLFFVQWQLRLRQPVLTPFSRALAAYFHAHQFLGQQQIKAVLVEVELRQHAVGHPMRVLSQGLERITLARGACDAWVFKASARRCMPETFLAHLGRFTLTQQGRKRPAQGVAQAVLIVLGGP